MSSLEDTSRIERKKEREIKHKALTASVIVTKACKVGGSTLCIVLVLSICIEVFKIWPSTYLVFEL